MDVLLGWWNIPVVRRTVISILAVVVAWLLYLLVRRIHRKNNLKRAAAGDERAQVTSVQAVIYDTIKVSIFAILILTILQVNGVNVTSLVAGLGVASAVIGLALQDFLKDIIMGVHIMMDDFYQIGDLVQIGEEEGIIENFNLRTTKIRSIMDGDMISICNRNLDRIIKTSTEVYIHQPMPYDIPSDRAEAVMNEIADRAAEVDGVVSGKMLGLNAFNNSSIDYLLKIEIEKPELKLRTRRDVLAMIRRVYEAEGIHVPFDQLDVHVKEPVKM